MAKHSGDSLSHIGIIVVGAGLIIMAYFGWMMSKEVSQLKISANDSSQITSVSYSCAGGATVQAQFFDDKAELSLGDGRSMLLMQGLSADGVRYTNSDESVTFWTKGNTAFLEEDGETTINNCVEQAQ
jgi:membrane-bound inhibitor of C-type lysozyme